MVYGLVSIARNWWLISLLFCKLPWKKAQDFQGIFKTFIRFSIKKHFPGKIRAWSYNIYNKIDKSAYEYENWRSNYSKRKNKTKIPTP